MPCFLQNNYTHKNFKEKQCPELDGSRATAPHTPSHTTSFRHPVHSDLLWKHRDSHTSLLSNLHLVPRLPRDWAIQVSATSWLCGPTPLLHQPYVVKSNPALLPPIELRTQKFQRKAMPRIRRGTFQTRAATAPHTASHTTSFRHPVHSDLLWKHRDSHTSLLSHLTTKISNGERPLDYSTTWLSYCELPLDYSTTWLIYSDLPLDYSTTWLSYCELPLDYSTTWLSYCELPLDYTPPLDWAIVSYLLITLPLDWAIVSFPLITLPLDWAIVSFLLITLPLDWAIVSFLLITLPLDWAIQLFVTTEVSN